MKKISLIVCALATTVASFAMVKEAPKKIFMRSSVPSITYVDAQFNNASVKKQVADLDTVFIQYRALGAYQVGVPSDGLVYEFYQQGLVAPYDTSLFYLNNDTLVSSWFIGGEKVADGVYYEQPIGFGEFELPVMKIEKSETTVYGDYQVAALHTSDLQTQSPNFYNALTVAPAGYATFTKCAMYTEDARQDKYGNDWKLVGAGQLGSYSYGSHLTNPWDGGYFDTIFVPFFQDGSMYIDHMTLGIYNSGSTSDEFFPGENDHVRLSIYPINADGEIEWDNALYRATANLDNFTQYYEGYGFLGLLQFNFLETDPITGVQTPTPITVTGDFVVALDEYNEGTTNVGFICDYYSQLPGQTYFVGRDQETGEQYVTTLWKSPSNILLNLVAYMPTMVLPETIAFTEGETEKTFSIPSNVWDEDIEIESDEWISVEFVTEYEVLEEGTDDEYWEHKFVNKMTVTIEASDEQREGKVIIDAVGAAYEITITQNGAQGIDNVTFKNDGKMYNVLGVEVGEDYKGIVIKNGQKFVR